MTLRARPASADSWIGRQFHIVDQPPTAATFAEGLALVRSKAAGAERSRLAIAEMTGRAHDQIITATESWEKHLAAAKAQARKLGGREGSGFAEVEAGIEIAIEHGRRDARPG